ncbi:Glutathione transport system permease protein gsiD [uncultured Clostridium sp.]|nr:MULTISPECIES: ABC transporter permease [unclassified Clostridium]RHS21982.1 ABC transporter permease [Clostridium sp. AF12-19]RHS22667.1 ABC transporter permease [Clostridium sp. AF12-28]SCH68176.1 Glutathione transport system permease protein gsiD [uncultured Clostridium sp.]
MSEQVQLDKKKSMKEEKIRAFMKNKLAVAGAVLLLTMIVLAALSPIIAPYGFDEQNYEIARQTPSLQHLAGTDELGRDIFSRILYGGRVSLTIGIISVGIGLIFGGSLGVIAAYYGGVTETVIMRVIDVLMAIPSIILSISICAALGSGIVNTMIAVGISSIPTYARVFRSSVISEKSKEYIEAARAVGAGNARIILKHILPNSIAPVIVQASLGVAQAITTAASLSFIGLGIQPPNPEWGALLSSGRQYIRDFPHMVVYPGIAIMLTVLALNLIGDGLRDALDPRLKR